MVAAKKTLQTIFCLLIALVSLATLVAADANDLRAQYAASLIGLTDGENYRVECGAVDVLPTKQHVSLLDLNEKSALCALYKTESKVAVMFEQEIGQSKAVIEHFLQYTEQNPNVNDDGNDDGIRQNHIDETACESADRVGDSTWLHCEDAVSGSAGTNARVYFQQGEKHTYLVTVGFRPEFDKTLWENFVDFLQGLFGLGSNNQGLDMSFDDGFARGYFSNTTDDEGNYRSVYALYRADDPSEDGRASIVFENFAINMSQLIHDANHRVGQRIQELDFEQSISPTRWKRLTAQLRITPTDEQPLPGPTCGTTDYVIPGYDCNPGQEDMPTCEDLGFAGGTITCGAEGTGNECRFDMSECFMCQDRDDDGHYADSVIPPIVRAIMNEPLLASSGEEASQEETAQLINIVVIDETSRDELETLVGQREENIDAPDSFDEYREQTDDIVRLTSHTHNNLEQTTSLPTTSKPILSINTSSLVSTYREDGDVLVKEGLTTTIYCAAIAQAVQQLQDERNLLFIHEHSGSSQEKLDAYRFCQQGLAASGEHLYFSGELTSELFREHHNVFDGLVTANPGLFVRDKALGEGSETTFRDLRRNMDGRLIVRSNNMVSAFQANPQAIIVPSDQLSELKELHELLTQDDLFIPRTNTLSTTPTVIQRTNDGEETVYLQTAGEGAPKGLDGFDMSCQGSLEIFEDGAFVSSDESLDSLSQDSYYRLIVSQPNCFIGEFSQGGCPLIHETNPVDCNDNNPTVYPGASVLCDGLNNSCNPEYQEPDTCELVTCNTQPISLVGVEEFYDAEQNFDYRYLRQGQSCQGPGCQGSNNGVRFVVPTNDERAVPLNRWWNHNTRNNFYTRAGYVCLELPREERTPDSDECMGEHLVADGWDIVQTNAFYVYPASTDIPGTININRYYLQSPQQNGLTTHVFVAQGTPAPGTVINDDGTQFRAFPAGTTTMYRDACEGDYDIPSDPSPGNPGSPGGPGGNGGYTPPGESPSADQQ